MKKLFSGILMFSSFSLFAQAVDWELIASQAAAMTDMELCFIRVLDKKATPSSCNALIVKAGKAGITREEASMKLYEIAKFKLISEKAQTETDKALNAKIKELVSSEDIESMIRNL